MQVWSQDTGDAMLQLDEKPDVLIQRNDEEGSNFNIDFEGKIYYIDEKSRIVDGRNKRIVGVSMDLRDGQQKVLAVLGSVEWVLIHHSSDEWQMIPAENLIAATRSTGTKLAFLVQKPSDVGGLAHALELGVDALCVNGTTASHHLWEAIFQARTEKQDSLKKRKQTVPIKPSIVTGTGSRLDTKEPVLADRVCVDLVQMLSPDEGCWIGSFAKLMALILSEAETSTYVPTRPFRINAGPVHSYICMADNSTKYLCELQAGDKVLVFNSVAGTSRGVAVGRLKQEVRPCVLIRLETPANQQGQIFLQQAETVRLGHERGKFLRASDLDHEAIDNNKPILLRTLAAGTHIGIAFEGSVEER
ncbi:unnamed protein product [Cylindrotheca closterium]|uniref:3-dehydroquinate synthase II n=1 Tax=Cylindrotheca closterium TaxID=2856 RepID=A0AAD2FQN4_9STRA|nr:unnamed protein product [Cylindrotheca closterium]